MPFDGTDAAVADVGQVEIERQPAGPSHESLQSKLIAPFVVYNYGFAERWELVMQGQTEMSLRPWVYLGRHHVAAMGLGNGQLQCGDQSRSRSATFGFPLNLSRPTSVGWPLGSRAAVSSKLREL